MSIQQIVFTAVILFGLASCDSGHKKGPTGKNNSEIMPGPNNDASGTTKNPSEFNHVFGIDISKFQGDELAYINNNANNLTFIICKATEGVTSTDPYFKKYWSLLKQKGITRGAYHYYHTSGQLLNQANHYLATIGPLGITDLPAIVYVEETSIKKNDNNSEIQKDLLQFLEILYQRTGRFPIVYTELDFANKQLTDISFAKYPLWIADYKNGTAPSIPKSWENTNWVFWQKSNSYKISGDTAILNDLDVFNGNREEFSEFLRGE